MATVKTAVGSLTSLTVTGLSTLASGTYVASNSYTASTNQPVDVMVEVTAATTNTPAGNKQIVVFAQASYDGGTTFQTGPTSGTTTTSEPSLTFLGVLPLPTASTTERKSFPVAPAYGGVVPPTFRIVLKNDLGVALTSGTVSTAEVSATVA
jgi:hypothetical protein